MNIANVITGIICLFFGAEIIYKITTGAVEANVDQALVAIGAGLAFCKFGVQFLLEG